MFAVVTVYCGTQSLYREFHPNGVMINYFSVSCKQLITLVSNS